METDVPVCNNTVIVVVRSWVGRKVVVLWRSNGDSLSFQNTQEKKKALLLSFFALLGFLFFFGLWVNTVLGFESRRRRK